jgi:hypothetical protein
MEEWKDRRAEQNGRGEYDVLVDSMDIISYSFRIC